jgi:hypothetical protein
MSEDSSERVWPCPSRCAQNAACAGGITGPVSASTACGIVSRTWNFPCGARRLRLTYVRVLQSEPSCVSRGPWTARLLLESVALGTGDAVGHRGRTVY